MSKGGGIGGIVGSITGNIVGAKYDMKAAKAAAAASGQAYKDYSNKVDFNIGRLDPYQQQGGAGMSALSGLLTGQQYDKESGGLKTISQQERDALFQKSPGYAFRLGEGQKALEYSQAAKGGLFSGAATKELGNYNQGMASEEYGNYINQLASLAGMGQHAATTQAGLGVYGASAGKQMNLDSMMGGANASRVRADAWRQTAPQVGQLGTQLASSFSGSGGFGSGGLGSFSTQLVNPMRGA
tara:strand:+ start:2399 stop:3121 length:723 start_codon:yes stop_codon:yes gene_type:complete